MTRADPAVSLAVVEGAVVRHVEGGVPVEVELMIHDGVIGIDHAQRLAAAHRTRLDAELARVAPAARELHSDPGTGAPLHPHHAGQIIDRDVVAGDGMPLWFLGGGETGDRTAATAYLLYVGKVPPCRQDTSCMLPITRRAARTATAATSHSTRPVTRARPHTE